MKRHPLPPPPKERLVDKNGGMSLNWREWLTKISFWLPEINTYNPTLDVGNIVAGSGLDFTSTIDTLKGLNVLDNVYVTPPKDLDSGLMVIALQCPAANTLKLRFWNHTGGDINPGSAVYLITTTRL